MTAIANVSPKISRRSVLKGASVAGFVLAMRAGTFSPFGEAEAAESTTLAPNVYLSIDPTGLVTITAHRSEMGTGIRTNLPLVLADELEADWTKVKIVQATGDKKYGDQNTDGSRSVRQFYQVMRVAGATARQMLEAAAAQQWGVPAEECRASNHAVIHAASKRQVAFGDLVAVAGHAARAGQRCAAPEDRGPAPLYRQADAGGRSARHRAGQGGVRHGRRRARHEACVDRALSRLWRHGEDL